MNRAEYRRSSRRGREGLTLVELLAVTAVMAILAGIVVGMANFASRRALESQVQAELQTLRTLLDGYRLDHGQYPQISNNPDNNNLGRVLGEGIERRTDWEEGRGSFEGFGLMRDTNALWRDYVDNVTFIDPWGRPYQYHAQGRFAYDLYSDGPTGTAETYDRIR